MPKILTITLEVDDVQVNNLLAHIAKGGAVASVTDAAGGSEDDEGAPNAAPPALDSAGVPWIDGIHATTKSVKGDGTWTGRRGVTAEMRAKAEADAKAALNGAPAAPTGFPTAAPAAPPVVGMPAMPGFPAVPPAPVTYDALIQKYMELANAGKVTPDSMNAIYIKCGVTDVNALQTDETLRAKIMTELSAIA